MSIDLTPGVTVSISPPSVPTVRVAPPPAPTVTVVPVTDLTPGVTVTPPPVPTVRVTPPPAPTVTVVPVTGPPGPTGPQGPAGLPGDGAAFRWDQLTPSTVWVITHGLGRYPAVATVHSLDLSQSYDEFGVQHLDMSTLLITTDVALAGTALLI